MINQSKGPKIYKKGKTNLEGSSYRSSLAQSSKIRVENSDKKYDYGVEEQNWIGTDRTDGSQKQQKMYESMPQPHQQNTPPPVNPFGMLGSAFGGSTGNKSTSSVEKPPSQLIQDILKGLSNKTLTEANPYYSEESQQKLGQILTNRNKMDSYISELENEMFRVDHEVVKNYEILIILLKQVRNSDVEVKHSGNGLQIGFNKSSINKQQNQIEKLEKSLKQKEEKVKQIVEDYESVIRNFNDVIERLLNEREGMENYGNQGYK